MTHEGLTQGGARNEHDLEDRVLAAHSQATIAVGYANHLLDHAGPVSLTGAQANALLEALRQVQDKTLAAASTFGATDV